MRSRGENGPVDDYFGDVVVRIVSTYPRTANLDLRFGINDSGDVSNSTFWTVGLHTLVVQYEVTTFHKQQMCEKLDGRSID